MSDEILISREEAKAAGLKFYFTGEACTHGHVVRRRTSNRMCVECSKRYAQKYYYENDETLKQKAREYYSEHVEESNARSRQWREENYEAARQYTKQYRQENADDIRQYTKQYRQENADDIRQYTKQYQLQNSERLGHYRTMYYHQNSESIKLKARLRCKENKSVYSANNARRRATKLQATPSWSETDLIQTVYEKRDELNDKWGTDYQVDHIIPLMSETVCGLHVWANLQLLEAEDNSSKHNKYQQDW